jgi:hypothetical protein
MPQVSGAPEGLNKILETAYAAALKEYKGDKTRASQAAWAAAKAKYKKVGGKWVPKKAEMEEIVIDAFKEGDYPQGKFGAKELSEIESTYDPTVYEAPIIVQHVSKYKGLPEIPAFGWIGAVKKVGTHLKLIASQFSDELKQWYKDGTFKKVSVALYQPDDPNNPTPGKWHLHHLAFLGGTPPAVKGLEGIQFSEGIVKYALKTVTLSVGAIEMQEMDAEVEVDGDVIDTVEEMGTEDTITDLSESCATFISKITDALSSGTDYDTVKQRCSLAASDLSNEVYNTLNMHWMFQEKLENIEEHKEGEVELSEKKGILARIYQSIITRKESNVDAQKEQDYKTQIVSLKGKVTQFEEKERVETEAKQAAETARLAAEKTAAEEAKKTEIKTFCDTTIAAGKMTPAMREVDEPIMFELSKTNADALKSFQQKYKLPVVPLGEVDINQGVGKPPEEDIFVKADKFIKEHPAEFKELTQAQARRKAILDKKV